MARNGITFSQVADICEALRAAGERISVRAIQARTGGSMTTVLKHYRQWKDGRGDDGRIQQQISKRLQQALLAELRQTADRTRETCLAEALREVTALKDRLAESEQRLAALEGALQERDRLCRSQEEMLRQLRQELHDAERLKVLAETCLEELAQNTPVPEPATRMQPKSKKPKSAKKNGEDNQEPNLFDF